MKGFEKMIDIEKNIKKLAITKKLNILVGSGASVPAIPLMGQFQDIIGKSANEQLSEYVQEASQKLLEIELKRECTISDKNIYIVLDTYIKFLETLVALLNISNSRQIPKNINIFTTNYDFFIEKATDIVLNRNRLVFNDGASGYFKRYLDSSNYNRTVSYKGLNDNYMNEIPSISLIKPHGSVNWKKEHEKILIGQRVYEEPVIVEPNGYEEAETFLSNHFHEMLRIFQLELDKPQSMLIVIGFSFQDKHIAKMVRRAIQNPELMVYAFGYSDTDRNVYLNNLGIENERPNFRIITPEDINTDENRISSITLSDLVNLLSYASSED